jgi:hypothetical protein
MRSTVLYRATPLVKVSWSDGTCGNVVDDGRFVFGGDDLVLDQLGELNVVLVVEGQLVLM